MNKKPILSSYLQSKQPSPIRLSQIEFNKRREDIDAINLAIGNVSLPMHPSMQDRMFNLNSKNSPFRNGVVKYTSTDGTQEVKDAFLRIVQSSGFSTEGLYTMVTDGASQAMELMIVGTCEITEKPLMLIDAAYTNYIALSGRLGITTVSMRRLLLDNGTFESINIDKLEKLIIEKKPGALLIIPYDNPTGNFLNQNAINEIGKLCVKYNIWLVSDEAYRELYYGESDISSVWGINEEEVKGITGRRISLESTSKVWNACGLRIGALITDNNDFYSKVLNDYTSNLCSNAIGQYIFGSIANEKLDSLKNWYEKQRNYYKEIMCKVIDGFVETMPKIVASNPESAIYSVIDLRYIVDDKFSSIDFMSFCAKYGKVKIEEKYYTLFLAPMSGFYKLNKEDNYYDPGRTQFRIAYIDTYERMMMAPKLFKLLLDQYMINNGSY